MERGEPPGWQTPDTERSERDTSVRRKPVHITVGFTTGEAQTASGNPLLKKPLSDTLYDATIEESPGVNGTTCKKTIGMLQGVTVERIGEQMQYKGLLSAGPDTLEKVLSKVEEGLETLRRRFRIAGSISITTLETAPSSEANAVELNHEAPPGNDQHRENDRDPIGADATRV